jgi:tRNA pseudouridine13 synthase
MRLMYLHAYQSYIWNEATSKRIELFGLKVCVGDLVKDKNDKDNILVLADDNIIHYNIYDVVLPLPGHNVIYPNNQSKRCFFIVNLSFLYYWLVRFFVIHF